MNIQEIFYLTMTVSMILAMAMFIYISLILVKTIKTIQGLLKSVKDTGESISMLKDGFQLGVFKIASQLLSKFKGGGENGKKE